MDDVTLGIILTLVGVVLLAAVLMAKQWHMPAMGKWFFGVLGAVFAVVGLVLAFGLINLVNPPQQIVEQATYDVTPVLTVAQTWVTYDTDMKTFTMAVDYNTTAKVAENGTGSMEVNVTIARSDVLSADYITSCSLGTVGMVAISGASSEYILGENVDGTFAFKWTKLGGAYSYENCNVKVSQDVGGFAILNVTLNNDALDGMVKYGSSTVDFSVAGLGFHIIAIEVLRHV
jgi:hypothetical protein